jgi:hypothetical protein
MFHFSFKLCLLSPLSCAYYNQSIHQQVTFNNTSDSGGQFYWQRKLDYSEVTQIAPQTFSRIG